jgi:cellulose synthase (UDP-forming)
MTPFLQHKFRLPHPTTLILLSLFGIAGLIALAWFTGQGTVSQLFEQLEQMQQQPPMWLDVPMQMGHFLLGWEIWFCVAILVVKRVSPRPQYWSRSLVVTVILLLAIRYWLWRSLSTLNLSTPLNGVFSLGVYGLELLIFVGSIIQLLLLLLPLRDRRSQADQLSQSVLDGSFAPAVDILIPTYNEPVFILRRTIIGCQALNYSNKTIHLLDGSKRAEMAALAAELGVHYITRPDNRHAKAGSLNHAIPRTQGELIVLFDADFIPTQNFLTRTVGFFQDSQVALVQTPQSFYNPDPIARNLGLEDILTPDEEVFYRQIQRIRDAAGSVICSGTSFVVRRSALTETGCFFTESLSEDFFTGIRLAAKGYQLVYLNEKLSAGLAAENMAGYALQRTRWAQGTLQAFFVSANPLTIAGLNLVQRLGYLEGLLHWFSSLSRIGFLLIPLAYAFLGVIPIRATNAEIFSFFLPYFFAQVASFGWLNQRSRSAILSEVYSVVLAFPLAITVFRTMLHPFGQGFKVTPKGTLANRYSYNWSMAVPLLILFIITAFSFWINLGNSLMMGLWQSEMPLEVLYQIQGMGFGWIWSAYNLLVLSISLLMLIDAPRASVYEWYGVRQTVQIQVGDQTHWGVAIAVSEAGAKIALTQRARFTKDAVSCTFLEADLTLSGRIETQTRSEVQVRFESLNSEQERALIQLLYCRSGQWESRCSPGELESLGVLAKTLLRPRIFFDQMANSKVIHLSDS